MSEPTFDELAKQAAAMREALLVAADSCPNCSGTGQDHDGEGWLNEPCPKCARIRAALASDAGTDYVSRKQMQPILELLRFSRWPGSQNVSREQVKPLVEALARINTLCQITAMTFEAQSFAATEISHTALAKARELGLLEDKP